MWLKNLLGRVCGHEKGEEAFFEWRSCPRMAD